MKPQAKAISEHPHNDGYSPLLGGGDAVTQKEYEALAGFRLELRRYLAFAQRAAQSCGVTMEQHQAMLAVRASDGRSLSVGKLAELLYLRHHSTVELVDRLVKLGMVERRKDIADARRANITLTETGEQTLQRLAASHLTELREHGPELVRTLRRATRAP